VYIVRTGVEDHLSALVSLEAIRKEDVIRFIGCGGQDQPARAVQTTMQVALSFIQELEHRELLVLASGQHPDPVESSQGLRAGYVRDGVRLEGDAMELGWRPEWDPFDLPSSRWVDTNAHPEWLAHHNFDGIHEHVRALIRRERRFIQEDVREMEERTENGNHIVL
jgi:hypothetical protein